MDLGSTRAVCGLSVTLLCQESLHSKSYAVYLFIVFRVAIVTEFILHVDQDDDAAGDADSQPHQVDKRITLVPFEISYGCF